MKYRVTFDAWTTHGQLIGEVSDIVQAPTPSQAMLLAEVKLKQQHPHADLVGGYVEAV
jgi:hypothetical protein